MAEETILSHSHYRETTFLFSYYSPVTMKTQNEGLHDALFIEKLPLLIINLGTCHEPEHGWKFSFKKKEGISKQYY